MIRDIKKDQVHDCYFSERGNRRLMKDIFLGKTVSLIKKITPMLPLNHLCCYALENNFSSAIFNVKYLYTKLITIYNNYLFIKLLREYL